MIDFIQKYPFVLAFFLGLIPALVWLWFWLKEDIHPEPAKMVTLSFIGGMLCVPFAWGFEHGIYNWLSGFLDGQRLISISFIPWAAIEEILKFVFIYFIALRNKVADEPIDDIIYLIIGALGFATLENALFLIEPISQGDLIGTLIGGNMRFVGSSLLHIMSSATIGIFLALSFYKFGFRKKFYIGLGIILAIVLHTTFNLFIINEVGGNIFFIFGLVWICIIALLLLFEKIKHIKVEGIKSSTQ